MKRLMIVVLSLAFFMVPGISAAQMHGGERGAHKAVGSMMHKNMKMMADMMDKMSKVMSTGMMTAEQQKKCAKMMKQMSQIMQEMMASRHGAQVENKQQKRLKAMEKELEPMFHAVHP